LIAPKSRGFVGRAFFYWPLKNSSHFIRGLACAFALLLAPAHAVEGVDSRSAILHEAYDRVYNFEFDAAHHVLDRFQRRYPDDALGYSVRGATYLFEELDRLGLLASEFFQDRGEALKKRDLRPDPKLKAKFEETLRLAREHGERALEKNPRDAEALFAMSMAAGMQSDYMYFVEKKRLASLGLKKESHKYSLRALEVDPKLYDAYLTTGFYEYLVGDLPFFMRWFVRFEEVRGDKQAGIDRLKLVAESSRYTRSFAKVILAAVYMREKRLPECREMLAELVEAHPRNPLFRKELQKLNEKLGER
jgi:hypothetical protein